MDMNWLWDYFEIMKMCNDNLRQAVAFMDEFPDYTMIQKPGCPVYISQPW
jgi:alpha-mannosidase